MTVFSKKVMIFVTPLAHIRLIHTAIQKERAFHAEANIHNWILNFYNLLRHEFAELRSSVKVIFVEALESFHLIGMEFVQLCKYLWFSGGVAVLPFLHQLSLNFAVSACAGLVCVVVYHDHHIQLYVAAE